MSATKSSGGWSSAFDSKEMHGTVRRAIKVAAGQPKPLAGRGIPLVIVLANPLAADG